MSSHVVLLVAENGNADLEERIEAARSLGKLAGRAGRGGKETGTVADRLQAMLDSGIEDQELRETVQESIRRHRR